MAEVKSTHISVGIALQPGGVHRLLPHRSLCRSFLRPRRQSAPCRRASDTSGATAPVEMTPITPNLQVSARLSVGSAKVETCLPFCHKVDSGMSLRGVRDDLCSDSGSPELTLLRPAPSIGMGQHELNVAGHRIPPVLSILIGGNKQRFRRIKQIAHEIREEVDNRSPHGEIGAHLILQCCRRICGSQQKLPPVTLSNGEEQYLG